MFQYGSKSQNSFQPTEAGADRNQLDLCVIEIESGPTPSMGEIPGKACSMAIWRPLGKMQASLDPGFEIRHEIEILPNGFRAIIPADHLRIYSARAWAVGRQLLEMKGPCSESQAFDTLALHLLFDRVRGSHGMLTRRFTGVKDLQVSYASKGLLESVLPEGLGNGPQDFGPSWSIAELLQHGEDRSARDGFGGRDFETTLAFGLMVAAEKDPYRDPPNKVPAIVQNSLFAKPKSERPTGFDEEIGNLVWSRLVTALQSHEDDTLQKFEAWFRGGNSNLVKSLAGGRKAAGGELSRDIVQWALYDFTWVAFQQAARCQDEYAANFCAAMRPALELAEQAFFSQIHCSQEYFGGLTLALVWDRQHQLMPILTRIASHRDSISASSAIRQSERRQSFSSKGGPGCSERSGDSSLLAPP